MFIVDDNDAVRQSLATLVESIGYPTQCFSSAEHFLIDVEALGPGIVVLDVRMPGMSGLELQRRLQQVARYLPVIIVTGHGNVPMSVEAMRAGAADIFEKPYDPVLMQSAIRNGLEKADELWTQFQSDSEIATRLEKLSARENDVCELLLKGLETREVARRLEISPSTVEKHRLRVFEKIGVSSVALLIRRVAQLD